MTDENKPALCFLEKIRAVTHATPVTPVVRPSTSPSRKTPSPPMEPELTHVDEDGDHEVQFVKAGTHSARRRNPTSLPPKRPDQKDHAFARLKKRSRGAGVTMESSSADLPKSRRIEINGKSTEKDSDDVESDVPLGARRNTGRARRRLPSSRLAPGHPDILRNARRDEHSIDLEDGIDRDDSSLKQPRRSDRTRHPPDKYRDEFNRSTVRDDRRRRESGPKQRHTRSGSHKESTSAQKKDVPETIHLDPDGASDDAVEIPDSSATKAFDLQSCPPLRTEDVPRQYNTRRRRRAESVELDKQKVAAEAKNLEAVDAPYTGPTHVIFSYPKEQKGKITVTAEERERLSTHKYLNDSLIDFYLKYLETDWTRRPCNAQFKTKFFSSFFFGVLRRSKPVDYLAVKNWTKSIDLFSTQFVFVPICDSYHWSLVIVSNLDTLEETLKKKEDDSMTGQEDPGKLPRIIYLDSLDPRRGMSFANSMFHYLAQEWLCRKQGVEVTKELQDSTVSKFRDAIEYSKPSVPTQSNEYDCGLYLLNSLVMFLDNMDRFRERLLRGESVVRDVYTHVDIQKLRKDIICLMNLLESEWHHFKDDSVALMASLATLKKVEGYPISEEHDSDRANDTVSLAIQSSAKDGAQCDGGTQTFAPEVGSGSGNAEPEMEVRRIQEERFFDPSQASKEDLHKGMPALQKTVDTGYEFSVGGEPMDIEVGRSGEPTSKEFEEMNIIQPGQALSNMEDRHSPNGDAEMIAVETDNDALASQLVRDMPREMHRFPAIRMGWQATEIENDLSNADDGPEPYMNTLKGAVDSGAVKRRYRSVEDLGIGGSPRNSEKTAKRRNVDGKYKRSRPLFEPKPRGHRPLRPVLHDSSSSFLQPTKAVHLNGDEHEDEDQAENSQAAILGSMFGSTMHASEGGASPSRDTRGVLEELPLRQSDGESSQASSELNAVDEKCGMSHLE